MLTLWAVAGLGVAALHCGGFGVGEAVFSRVQVPVLVRADHLSVSRAGATARGALEENAGRDFNRQDGIISHSATLSVSALFFVSCRSHQAPLSNVPADRPRADRHLTGSDCERAVQSAAGCFLQPHSS